jgi:hypothetical protein
VKSSAFMGKFVGTALLLATTLPAWAAEAPIDIVTGKAGVFIHLDASGRKNLAVSEGSVAIVWEDNRGGAPRCQLGLKSADAATFREYPLGKGECFEPAVSALDGGRFLLAWEDETGVNAALANQSGPGPVARLADAGGQATTAWHPKLGAFAAWSSPDGRWRRIWQTALAIDGTALKPGAVRPADAAPAADDQLFPTLAAPDQGFALAWEDRRHGHTVIYGTRSGDGQAWSAPLRISGNPTGKAQGDLGRGTGAMRPALASFGGRLAAAWLDKRDFLSGYDVYATLSDDGGVRFAKDGKAQDSFGDSIAQWHVAAAGNRRGDLVIAFDDERDGTADIWLTPLTRTGYGENITLPATSGPGRQTDPAIALDEAGNLHLAWLDQDGEATTRLRYTVWPPQK